MKNNLYDHSQQDVHATQYQRRHLYVSESVSLDGRSYTVVSAVPLLDADYRPETAADKLKYLINGDRK